MGDNSVKSRVINNVLHKKYIALNPLNNKDMYLIQKATRIVNNWALNEDDALIVLNDFIKANSELIDHYYVLPHLTLEKDILSKLESFACDYLFANQLSYL